MSFAVGNDFRLSTPLNVRSREVGSAFSAKLQQNGAVDNRQGVASLYKENNQSRKIDQAFTNFVRNASLLKKYGIA